jgi:hypothetical protein
MLMVVSVEVEGGTEMLVGVAEVTGKGVNAEIDFPARVFAPAILPPSPAESEDFFACGGFEVFDIESFHGACELVYDFGLEDTKGPAIFCPTGAGPR